jgi:hypothetical protein
VRQPEHHLDLKYELPTLLNWFLKKIMSKKRSNEKNKLASQCISFEECTAKHENTSE